MNYASTGGAVLETIINGVVFFRYECETGILRVFVKGTSTRDKEHLFKELTLSHLKSGAALHDFAKECYQEHLEELKRFVKGE